MRIPMIALAMTLGLSAQAQDGAHTITLSEVRQRRAELSGSFIRVENVTISGFTMARGGMASDSTGGVRLDDSGMPQDTITYLERHCSQGRAGAATAACRGTLEFTVAGHETAHGGFTISDAQFIPQS